MDTSINQKIIMKKINKFSLFIQSFTFFQFFFLDSCRKKIIVSTLKTIIYLLVLKNK
jgi:hypothetical protein